MKTAQPHHFQFLEVSSHRQRGGLIIALNPKVPKQHANTRCCSDPVWNSVIVTRGSLAPSLEREEWSMSLLHRKHEEKQWAVMFTEVDFTMPEKVNSFVASFV